MSHGLDTCPVCKAKLRKKKTCRRCKTDLAPLLEIQTKARHQKNLAISACEAGRFQEMFSHARRSHTLDATPESAWLLACASLMVKRFEFACFLWKKLKLSKQ